ncbi:MAG TPA: hypothetical protein VMH05_12825 [Bryobacteraceae bacterium]|nr:hypothetical protein [Bryobacteraceae bacterium]
MNQFTRRASLLTVFLGFLAATVSAADVGGKWIGDVNTPDGQTISLTFTFKVDAGKVTGTVSGPTGDIDISDGKIDGETLQFGLSVDAGGQQMSFKCTGKLAADDQMKITMDGGGDLNFQIDAKRST